MSPTEARARRAEAMQDADEGRLPDAELKLDALVATLAAAGESRTQLVAALSDRATVRRYANRWDDSLADLSDAEKAARALPELPKLASLPPIIQLRAKLLAIRGGLLDARGEGGGAALLRTEAHALAAELRTLRWVPWAADEVDSDLAFREREWDRAADLALRVAAVLRAEGWEQAEARLRLRAGRALLELNDFDRAEPHLRFAFEFFDRRGPAADLAPARLALARLAHARGRPDDAWEYADRALRDIEGQIRLFRVASEQGLFLLDKADYYARAFEIALAQPGPTGLVCAWSVAERAKSFYLCQLVANADVSLFEGVDPADIARLAELERIFDSVEMKLGRIGFAPSPERAELEAARAGVSSDRERLLARMMTTNPRWAALRAPPALDLPSELAKLDAVWTPISFFWGPREDRGRRLQIFSNTREGPRRDEVPWSSGELASLDAACERLRGSPRVDPSGPLIAQAFTDKLLPPPLRAAIGDGQRLLVSPHDVLRSVPLHALSLGDDEIVIDRWPVQYLPTFALLALRRQEGRPKDVLALGCVRDSFGGRLLADVIDEIDDVRARWSDGDTVRVRTAMLPQDGASLAELRLEVGSWDDFGVVHLACHGVFPEGRPFDAALRLGDTQVGPSDFFAARLRCSTIALSACALGRSVSARGATDPAVDEWAGLHIPLFYAGAGTLVLSLWDADSKTARLFMSTLHGALTTGDATVIAVKKAADAVRTRPLVAWANWFVSGLPN